MSFPWRWLSLWLISIAAFDQEMCVVGTCLDPVYKNFKPTPGSFLLVLVVSSKLATYNLYPSSLKELPWPLRYLYDVLAVLYLSTFAVRYLWITMKTFGVLLTHIFVNVLCLLSSCACLEKNWLVNLCAEAMLASDGEVLVCVMLLGYVAFNYHLGLQKR